MIRFLSILLLMIYTLTSSGATVYYHQCGQNAQISLSDRNASHDSCKFCSKKEQEHKKEHHCQDTKSCSSAGDCCHDVQIELKNTDEQLNTSHAVKDFTGFSPAEITLYWVISYLSFKFDYSTEKLRYKSPSSTPLSSLDTYLLNGNFRI